MIYLIEVKYVTPFTTKSMGIYPENVCRDKRATYTGSQHLPRAQKLQKTLKMTEKIPK